MNCAKRILSGVLLAKTASARHITIPDPPIFKWPGCNGNVCCLVEDKVDLVCCDDAHICVKGKCFEKKQEEGVPRADAVKNKLWNSQLCVNQRFEYWQRVKKKRQRSIRPPQKPKPGKRGRRRRPKKRNSL